MASELRQDIGGGTLTPRKILGNTERHVFTQEGITRQMPCYTCLNTDNQPHGRV